MTDFLGLQPAGPDEPAAHRSSYFRTYGAQTPGGRFDLSVVMPTILRPQIEQALRSVFAQHGDARIQTLIGVDNPDGDIDLLDRVCEDRPSHHEVSVFYPGYSTSARHGGLHPAWDGGTLRTVLTYLAASRNVAYLDDDNWWAPSHAATALAALEGKDWAWAQRYFVHPRSRQVVCEDIWESVGPHTGIHQGIGGWVDPNCIVIDKLRCEAVIRWWSIPLRNSPNAMTSDRNVFRILRSYFNGQPMSLRTVYYAINENDPEHEGRLALIGRDHYESCGAAVAQSASA